MPDAHEIIREILEFIKEMEIYEGYKEELKSTIKKINAQYQNKGFGYLEYESQLKTILKDKSEEEWTHYYNAYLFSLIKKIDFLLAQLYSEIYEHRAEIKIQETFKEKKAETATAEKKAAAETITADLDEEIKALKQQLKMPAQKGVIAEAKIDTAFVEKVKKLREKIREKEEREERAVLAEAEEQRALEEQKEKLLTAKQKAIEERKAAEKKGITEAAKTKGLHLPIKIYSPKAIIQELSEILKKGANITKLLTKIKMPKQLPKLPKLSIRKKPAEKIFTTKETMPLAKPAAKQIIKFSLTDQIKAVLSKLKTAKPQLKRPVPKLPFAIKKVAPKKRQIFFEEIVGMEKAAKQKEKEKIEGGGLLFGWPLGKKLLQDVLGRFKAKQEPIMGATTEIPGHIKKLREMRARLYVEEKLGTFKPTLLAEEAHRVKALLEQGEKPEVYRGSSIGLIANVSVKKISLWLVDTFPEFFGYLYNALRAANVKILSNTYVNIMILCTAGIFFILAGMLTVIFFALNHPIYQILTRSFAFSLLGTGLCATIFYLYPFMKIKERRKSITTNMPFAINHIASVSASGVPPSSMFELISQSGEYGEVAIEIKKIVDFVQIFGYDLLTAIKSVAATTPSIEFKEFLEGMVSTIETGGDLESYLKQQAQQSTLRYQLERQRYNETISTYSDLYTGLLIAAPLFFIASLALINMLGGSLAGMSVDMVMAMGAYLIIPALNLAFLAFLQMSQPSV